MSFRLFSPSGRFKRFRIKELNNERFIAVDEKHPSYKSSAEIRFVVRELKKLNESSESKHVVKSKVLALKARLDGESQASQSNTELAEAYLRDVMSRRKIKSVSKKTARQYLMRALKAIGSVSIQHGSEDEIQRALDSSYPNEDQRQRQLAMYLNCLLGYLKRDDVLIQKYRQSVSSIKFVRPEDIEPIANALRSIETREINMEAFILMVKMAVFSGLRVGELFALQRSDYDERNNRIFVSKQIDTNQLLDVPKGRKTRIVACFPEMKTLYFDWLKQKSKVPFEVRVRAARILTQACKKAFPDEPEKWIVFHGCRHSFAIRCLEAGLTMEMIARQLGNTVKVCERYYTGFVHTDVTLDQVSKLLSKSDA